MWVTTIKWAVYTIYMATPATSRSTTENNLMLKVFHYASALLGTALISAASYAPVVVDSRFSVQPLPFVQYNLTPTEAPIENNLLNAKTLFSEWQLGAAGLSEKAFECAMKGYQTLVKKGRIAKQNILSIVDFSKPSSQKRLFVLDMVAGKILFNTLLSHGKNSGNEYATRFSNQPESHQSSLGFYLTLGTYTGSNGYSLKLQGCDRGFNDKALARAIVLHGAEYASPTFLQQNGYLGRSHGCPAVPEAYSRPIIEQIKNGSCLFLYYPNKQYLKHSTILNS